MYVAIHNYRKTDTLEHTLKQIEYSNDVIEDINKEVDVYEKSEKDNKYY